MTKINFKDFSKNCPWNNYTTCNATTNYITHYNPDDCEESNCGLLYAINKVYAAKNKTSFREHIEKCAEKARKYPAYKQECMRPNTKK